MAVWYEKLVRPLLFRLEAEKAHELGVTALELLGRAPWLCAWMQSLNQPSRTQPIEVFGLKFPNAVGLAAGMDKSARMWRAASALGFGHVEIGTITQHPQPGNEKPRVFRYPREEALVNRMGFNNLGAEAIAQQLKATGAADKRRIPLGINIGKSKVTPLDRATEDYLASFNRLAAFADYFAINVSSPNTPDLRRLQTGDLLAELLKSLQVANRQRAVKLGKKEVPLLVKIAPDLGFREIDAVLSVVQDHGVAGLIATNTTVDRTGARRVFRESGGLSGRPLHRKSVHVVNYIYRATNGRLPIIGVGGIMDPVSAGAMLDAGASLVQSYTGFVYRGPFFPADLARALATRQRDFR
jgi:dihydroorotate dehydrogenase